MSAAHIQKRLAGQTYESASIVPRALVGASFTHPGLQEHQPIELANAFDAISWGSSYHSGTVPRWRVHH